MTPHILIAGGGVAALEALIALHELAPDRQRVTLLAPEPDFVYRPMSVAEPFCLGHAAHHPLTDIAREFGAALVRDSLGEIDPEARTVTTGSGETIAYDSLLIAVGARPVPVYRHAITFGADGAPEALSGLLSDLEDGYARPRADEFLRDSLSEARAGTRNDRDFAVKHAHCPQPPLKCQIESATILTGLIPR